MKKRLFHAVLIILLMLFSAGDIFGAENKAEGQKEEKKAPTDLSEDGWISNGRALGPWWQRNPKKYEPMALPLLYHFELTYSYSDTGGNTDMESHKGNLALILRKHAFTSDTSYNISKQETTMNLQPMPSTTKVEKQTLMHDFMFALTDRIGVDTGFIWLKNDSSRYIENRKAYYGGLGFNVVDRPTMRMLLGAYYGYADTSYMNEKVPPIYFCPPAEYYDSDMLFFNMRFNWDITDIISLSQAARYQLFLNDTEYYNWSSDTSLNFRITENIFFTTTYSIDYEKNSFIENVQNCLDATRARGLPAGDMEETDTTLSAGITLKF